MFMFWWWGYDPCSLNDLWRILLGHWKSRVLRPVHVGKLAKSQHKHRVKINQVKNVNMKDRDFYMVPQLCSWILVHTSFTMHWMKRTQESHWLLRIESIYDLMANSTMLPKRKPNQSGFTNPIVQYWDVRFLSWEWWLWLGNRIVEENLKFMLLSCTQSWQQPQHIMI